MLWHTIFDALRLMSCEELFNRVSTMDEKWYEDVLATCKAIVKGYGNHNYTLASGLYDEIQAYVAMSEGEKKNIPLKMTKPEKCMLIQNVLIPYILPFTIHMIPLPLLLWQPTVDREALLLKWKFRDLPRSTDRAIRLPVM